ncbi:hypothetical protein J5X84_23200 [Streptosporangiaceae bacterium NEAU-GS5]|nr:hypothetical protein [Streptosporangiaceae bacterium NEAU-GS5]
MTAVWACDQQLAGERALHVDGDLIRSRRLFHEAYVAAERDRDGDAMARAALGLGGVWVHEHRSAADAALVRARQEHALQLIEPGTALALRLRARLAGEEDYRHGSSAAVLSLVSEARRMGEPEALTEAISLAHHCLLGPQHASERLELANEMIGQAGLTGRPGDLVIGMLWRTVDLFLTGDPRAERSLIELRERIDTQNHLAVAFVVSAMDVMLSIRAGRFLEAEKLATICADQGEAAGDVDATGWFGGQIGTIRWYQGRIAELLPVLSELVNSPTLSATDNSYFAALATAAAAAGDHRLAAGMLARLHGRHLADLPRSSSWLMSMYGIVEAAHLIGDAEIASRAYALLSPYAHLPIIASLGVTCLGSVHHALGMAALTMGDTSTAIAHFRDAIARNLGLNHWPAVTMSRWRLGQTLALRNGIRDQAAHRELAAAEKEADELGMRLPALPSDRRRTMTRTVTCQRRGVQWAVELGTRTALLDDSVGMRHLTVLLANPGREIRAIHLASGFAEAESDGMSAQPVLDDVARRTYEERLAELQAHIEELEALQDNEQAAALGAERDWLVAELAAATGMGGRARQFTDDEERARIAVGKAVRRALNRIAMTDPIIGDELRATIQTGLRCSYRPR